MPVDSKMIDGWSSEMRRHAYSTLDAAENALGALQGQASELVAAFRDKRKVLVEQAQRELDARTLMGRRPKKVYAPLNLFTRVREGGLELCWQEVHRNRVTRKLTYKYLRLSRDGNADLRVLLARALPFEKELIRETESHAKHIRTQWRQWVGIRAESGRVLHLSGAYLLRSKVNDALPPTDLGASNNPRVGVLHEWVPAAEFAITED